MFLKLIDIFQKKHRNEVSKIRKRRNFGFPVESGTVN